MNLFSQELPPDLIYVGDDEAWAVTSKDDRYRYVLGRTWNSAPKATFCMINPSTARGAITKDGVRSVKDDPTIRKCVGFAKRWGAGGIIVVNALAISETNPDVVVQMHARGEDVVGPQNKLAHAAVFCSEPRAWIAAWGRIPPKLRDAAAVGLRCFLSLPRPVQCLGVTADGSPRHPLMLPYVTPLQRFHVDPKYIRRAEAS